MERKNNLIVDYSSQNNQVVNQTLLDAIITGLKWM